jgi:hypothetical protein
MLVLIVALAARVISLGQTETNHPSFGIYLTRLSQEEIRSVERTPIPVDRIPLEQIPLISERDIVEYDFNRHIMKLTPEAFQRVSKVQVTSVSHGIPFVVVASGARHYMGVFWSDASSATTSFPSVPTPITSPWYAERYGTNCIPICPPTKDIRVSTYMALKQLGLLKSEQ